MNAKLAALLEVLDEYRAGFYPLAYMSIQAAQYDLLREALREREGMVLVPRADLEEINRDAWSDDKTRLRLIARATDRMLAAAEEK